jgi:glycosyltransferase involved in cell wall biosynthesis
MPPRTSIVVVNYRTPRQIKLCLRSLRRYTHAPHEVIVVDNGSADASSAWLRTLSWIRLVENPSPLPMHQRALDLGIAASTGEVICVLHSDSYVHAHGWLGGLLGRLGEEHMMLGTPDRVLLPGGWLSRLGAWRRRRRRERRWRMRGRTPKLLTHCALYRRALFTAHGQRFDHPERSGGRFVDTGEPIQRYCEERGLGIRVLSARELSPLIWHFEGATLDAVRHRRHGWKRRLRARRFWRRADVRALLSERSLDA